MKLQRRKIERDANDTINAMTRVRDNAALIEERANADGYGGFGPGTNGRSPGVSDPTAAAALSPRDRQAELTAGLFRDALHEANRAAQRAERLGLSLLALDAKTARKLAKDGPADASGWCANPACGVRVLNLPNDRLRQGRCEPCYRYRLDHGNERPRELAQEGVS